MGETAACWKAPRRPSGAPAPRTGCRGAGWQPGRRVRRVSPSRWPRLRRLPRPGGCPARCRSARWMGADGCCRPGPRRSEDHADQTGLPEKTEDDHSGKVSRMRCLVRHRPRRPSAAPRGWPCDGSRRGKVREGRGNGWLGLAEHRYAAGRAGDDPGLLWSEGPSRPRCAAPPGCGGSPRRATLVSRSGGQRRQRTRGLRQHGQHRIQAAANRTREEATAVGKRCVTRPLCTGRPPAAGSASAGRPPRWGRLRAEVTGIGSRARPGPKKPSILFPKIEKSSS